MATLYIIGNGFDKQHRLKTSYWDFRCYLEKYAEDFLMGLENMYSIAPFERLDKRYKKNRDIQKRRDDAIFNMLWKNFELCLGEANESEMLDFSESIVNDLDLESGPVEIRDTMNVYWEEQYSFIEQLNDFVGRWIKQVRLFKAKPIKEEFINNTEDYFFTFNYTGVLERIYNVPSKHILHIHGGVSPYCNVQPILGHGNVEKIEMFKLRAEDAVDEEKECIYKAIYNFYRRTWKDTSSCMAFHDAFYKELTKVDRVEVIGHSFGSVDMAYFNYLKYCVSKDTNWKFFYHSEDDCCAAKVAVKELEFEEGKYEVLPSSFFWK